MSTRQYGRSDVDFDAFYSDWMKRLAAQYSKGELEARLPGKCADVARSTAAHLRAIDATTSMKGQSSRRAHTRNCAAAAGEELMAIRGAIEIHELFPEHAARCGADGSAAGKGEGPVAPAHESAQTMARAGNATGVPGDPARIECAALVKEGGDGA